LLLHCTEYTGYIYISEFLFLEQTWSGEFSEELTQNRIINFSSSGNELPPKGTRGSIRILNYSEYTKEVQDKKTSQGRQNHLMKGRNEQECSQFSTGLGQFIAMTEYRLIQIRDSSLQGQSMG
jgi:hypothetical protein